MRTSNPALQDDTFYRSRVIGVETMTVPGVIMKTILSLLLLLLTAGFTWMQVGQNPASATPWMMGGLIAGFIIAMATVFKKEWSPVTAPLYALAEGLFIGGASAILEQAYPGIAFQAVSLTFGTLFAMLLAYRSGLIPVTEKFKLGIVAATGGIAIVYLVALVLSFFGINLAFVYSGGTFGILFSLFVVTIAALNLVLDFDSIEQGAKMGAPKYMEWYSSFALMVTLVWLYIEFLRLLAKMRER